MYRLTSQKTDADLVGGQRDRPRIVDPQETDEPKDDQRKAQRGHGFDHRFAPGQTRREQPPVGQRDDQRDEEMGLSPGIHAQA